MLGSENLPASVIQAASLDPAQGTGAPPNFGMDVVPHVHTASGRFGVSSHSYLNMDEALRDSRQNAQRMRQDCGIMECVESRQRSVALLPWHIAPADEKSPEQKDLAAKMTAILEETPRFTELRRSLLEAAWYGRSAIANSFGAEPIGYQWRTVVKRWEPRHGDKLVFRFDDGSHTIDPDQVGIRVSAAFRGSHGRSPGSDGRSKVQATETGLVYWLDRAERQTMIIHKHMVEDGPWEEPRMMGRIHGIGIRDRIYWTWYAMTECLQRVMEYLDRAAFGIEVWPYQAGNPKAKAETERAAFGAMGGGRTVILAPIPPGDVDADLYMPKLIEPGLGGIAQTIDIIKSYFGHKIKRYILGQTLSSEAESTGMGSSVADAHMATLADILAYDAVNLEETLTKDFLRVLQLWNFRNSGHVKLKFRIDTESDNVVERLNALRQSWEMGLKIKADELYQIVGIAKPDQDDEILVNPKIQMPGMPASGIPVPGLPGGGVPGSGAVISPESFHTAFHSHLAARGMAA